MWQNIWNILSLLTRNLFTENVYYVSCAIWKSMDLWKKQLFSLSYFCIFLRLRVTQNVLQLPMFFFLRLHGTQKALQSLFFSFPHLPPSFSFLALFFDGLAKVIFTFFSNFYFKHLWPGSSLLIWYAVCIQVMALRDKQRIDARESGIFFLYHWNYFISTTAMPMTTKLGRFVTYR